MTIYWFLNKEVIMLVLFTDSDTDITPKEASEYGYNLISMPYSIDGVTTYPYRDNDSFDFHTFYESLRNGVLPTTSTITEQDYIDYFEPHFANGDDILYVHFSRAMTGTFTIMDNAVAKLKGKYPDRKFYDIDTKGITIISYNIVKEIGDLYKAGKNIDEILAWAKEEINHFAVYFFADNLKFFKHSGRVSGLAGTMGTLLGIRPIIYMNEEGKMVNIGKEKGRINALNRLVGYVEELGCDIDKHRIIVASTDNDEMVDRLIDELTKKFGNSLNIERVTVNPTAGSHCGPDTVGVCFHAIHR